MMQKPSIDILESTYAQFVERAAMRGIRRALAHGVYLRAFREGQVDVPWAALPVPLVSTTQIEGPTKKFCLLIESGLETESVIIPLRGTSGRSRITLCVSSQVGCAMGCTFCETAQMGLMRNLTASQIVAQWHAARFQLHAPIDNIVFMGMGEPMDNFDAVQQAIHVLTDHLGAAVAASRITISTVGHVEGLARMADLMQQRGLKQINLAVSVNAPNDSIRSQIMPINRAAPMKDLMQAMLEWQSRTGRGILIEYVLIPGVNDSLDHADELCAYLKPVWCRVNVIPYNPRRDSPWPAPREGDVELFVQRIIANGQFAKRRYTTGRSVMAACGQLGNAAIRRRRFVDLGAAELHASPGD